MPRYVHVATLFVFLMTARTVSAKSLWDRAGDAIRPVVRAVVPAKLSCIQWTGHPLYSQMTVFMQENKDELRRNGITDVRSCKNSRDLVIKLSAAKGLFPFAGITWDLGRCVCERVF
mgnify:CR=1 FL=1